MVHFFEPPIHARNNKQKGKRRRSKADDDALSPSATDEAAHDHVQDTDEEEQPRDFPHAPHIKIRDVQKEPLVTKQRNIKYQHFLVLNTILHKSLLEHDFARAGRAFGMLLRFEVAGQRLDLRKKAIWGIGAEILLHRPSDYHIQPASIQGDADRVTTRDDANSDSTLFTDAGFEAARAYYDRLILQYPYKRTRPSDVSSQHFYPAMFGLWIFQAQSQSQRATAALDTGDRSHSDVSSSPLQPSPMQMSRERGRLDGEIGRADSSERRLRRIKTRELEQARAITTRLDELLLLPPFDRDAQLLKLQGMVALWEADLLAAVGGQPQVESETLRKHARTQLRRARDAGWKVWEGVSHLVEEDVEVMSEDW